MAKTALRLLRGASLYSVAIFAPRLVRLVTVPLVVHAVSIEVYGVFAILMMIVPFAQVVADSGTGTASLRLAPDEKSSDGRRSLFASLLATRVLMTLAVATLLVLAMRPLTQALTSGNAPPSVYFLVIANVLPGAILAAMGDQLRSDERHTTLALLTMGQALLEAGLTVSWVVLRPGGLRGLVLAVLCARLVVAGAFLVVCRATFRARPTLGRAVALLRLGAPIGVLYVLTGLREFDRYLVKRVLGLADVARYDLALRIVGPVALANVALAMVLQPHVYRTFHGKGGREMIALFLAVYVTCFGALAFGVSAFAPEIFPLLAPGSYRDAALVAPTLIFAFVGDGVLRVVGLGADFAKRTIVWGIVAVTHVVVGLPLTWVLLPRLGLLGAAFGILVATLATNALCRTLVQRIFPLELPVGRALGVIVLGSACSTALVAHADGHLGSIVLRAVATIVFAAVTFRVFQLDLPTLRAVVRGDEIS